MTFLRTCNGQRAVALDLISRFFRLDDETVVADCRDGSQALIDMSELQRVGLGDLFDETEEA